MKPSIPTMTVEEFWSHASPEPNTGCWLWDLSSTQAYPLVRLNGVLQGVHRHALELHLGHRLPPEGRGQRAWACHRCDVKSCINPSHLYAGSPRDNVLDVVRRSSGWRERRSAAVAAVWRQPGFREKQMAWLKRLREVRASSLLPPARG